MLMQQPRMHSVPILTAGSLRSMISQAKATTLFKRPAVDSVVLQWADLTISRSQTWHPSQSWVIRLTGFSLSRAWVFVGTIPRASLSTTRPRVSYWWNLVCELRPACAPSRTFLWMSLCLAGFSTRKDLLGVTSIVRALGLEPACYDRLLD